MKREECTVGATVYTDDGPRYRYLVRQLPDENDMVVVEAAKDSSWAGSGLDTFHLEDLRLFDEEKLKKAGADLQAKIDAAKSAFEIAFEALQQVREFDADGVSHWELSDMKLVSTRDLENTMEDGGWSSSSLWC